MKITGQDIALSVREWIKDEIKSGPAKEYDLGKFFFTVASGTLGFVLVAAKLTDDPSWSSSLAVSFLALIAAIAVALVMVIPKKWFIEGSTDLFDKRAAIIKRTIREARLWFCLWLIGIVWGILAVLK